MNLYSCRSVPEGYRLTKHDMTFEPLQEGDRWCSYITTATTCTCPAGKRPSCKHRKMLGRFLERGHISDGWYYNDANGMWHRNTDFEPASGSESMGTKPAHSTPTESEVMPPDPIQRESKTDIRPQPTQSAGAVPAGFVRRV